MAVLDGQVVKLTPFKYANIPPPMALYELEVSSNSVDVAFNNDVSSVAVLHQEGISLFESRTTSAASTPPKLISDLILDDKASENVNYQQISFGNNNQIIVLSRGTNGDGLHYFELDSNNEKLLRVRSDTLERGEIATISHFSQDGKSNAFMQGLNGRLQSLESGSNPLTSHGAGVFFPWLEITHHRDGNIAFGMSTSGHLYANSRQLVKNCTSFLVTPAHLIFTTTTHLLKFVHITDVEGKLRRNFKV